MASRGIPSPSGRTHPMDGAPSGTMTNGGVRTPQGRDIHILGEQTSIEATNGITAAMVPFGGAVMNANTVVPFDHAMGYQNNLIPLDQIVESSNQNATIVELTRRLVDREAEMMSIAQQNLSLTNAIQNGGADSYNDLMAYCMDQEARLQCASKINQELEGRLKVLEKSVYATQETLQTSSREDPEITKKMTGLEKLVVDLQKTTAQDRQTMQVRDAALAQLKRENESNRVAITAAEDMIKKKQGVIEYLTKEKDEMARTIKESEKTADNLREVVSSYEDKVSKRTLLAENQINFMQENKKALSSLQDKNSELEKELKIWKDRLEKDSHEMESKDVLLNMQRQELERQEDLIQIYEKRFKAKNTDLPKVIARADEGDRVWARIEEREKKYQNNEIVIGALRNENENLQGENKRLSAEVKELKKCFEKREIMISGTQDKVQMPWLLSQLRDTIQLREKVVELEDIIKGCGYTVKAAEAEAEFKEKEREITLKMEKLTQIIDALKDQTGDNVEIPVLLGKLEECLVAFGIDFEKISRPTIDDLMTQILSAASSDVNQSMSLNSADSYGNDKWANSACITTRDCKDFMHPKHYMIVSTLAAGFRSLKTEGICTAVDDDDEGEIDLEDRDDFVDTARGGVDKVYVPDTEERTEVAENPEQVSEPEPERDIHIEKVLNIIAKNEEDLDDWRKWISPPTSPLSQITAE